MNPSRKTWIFYCVDFQTVVFVRYNVLIVSFFLQLPEVQFFGASTLHTKISRHWSDLPADQHETLRMQLLSHILHFSSGPKMVLTRLCVSLASMALNLIPQAWSHPVADMVRAFQPQKPTFEGGSGAEASQDPQAHCLALLELLTVLPEEFQCSRLAQARRAQLRGALAAEWAVVCPMLRQLLQSQDSSNQVKEKVLRCLSSWVALDVPLGESHELVQDCFAALSNPELFDTAVETIVNALSQPDCQRWEACRFLGSEGQRSFVRCVTENTCVQVYWRSGEPDASGAGSSWPAEDCGSGRRHGDLTWDLSYRCCHGRNTLQVHTDKDSHDLNLRQCGFYVLIWIHCVCVWQGFIGTVGSLAGVSGFGQHDSVLHRYPWSLPRHWDHQLPHAHLLVLSAGTEADWKKTSLLLFASTSVTASAQRHRVFMLCIRIRLLSHLKKVSREFLQIWSFTWTQRWTD